MLDPIVKTIDVPCSQPIQDWLFYNVSEIELNSLAKSEAA